VKAAGWALAVAIVVVLTLVPMGTFTETVLALPRGSYFVCDHVENGWAGALLRDPGSGRVGAVLLYSVESGASVLLANDLDLGILAVGGPRGAPSIVALDLRNGSINVMTLYSIGNISSNRLSEAIKEYYSIKIKNGFIQKAYATIHNTTAQVYALAVFTKGNKSSLGLAKIDISLSPTVKAEALRASVAGLTLTGPTPCTASLINITNESLDIAPLFIPRTQGVKLYHVPVKNGAKPDPLSILARKRLAGTIIVSHKLGQTSSLIIVDIDEHEAKAFYYTSPPIPGYIMIDPVQIARYNNTAYLIGAWAIQSNGTQKSIIILADLGFNPHLTIYAPRGTDTLGITDSDFLLLLSGSNTSHLPYDKMLRAVEPIMNITLNRTATGFTYESIRFSTQLNLTIENIGPPSSPTEQNNTTTTPANTSTASKPTTSSKPPVQNSNGAIPAKESSKAKHLAAVGLVAGVAIAGAIGVVLVKRRSKPEELGTPVFRY